MEEGLVDCFYCKKMVPETAWRCPNCRRFFKEGKIGILGIIIILALVVLLVLYLVQPAFLLGGEEEETEKKYRVDISLDTGPEKHKARQGGYTQYGIRAINLANAADTILFSSEDSSPLALTFDDSIPLASGDQALNVIRVDVPIITPLDSYNFQIYATSKADPTAKDVVNLTVEVVTLSDRYVTPSDKVQCYYLLWLEEGDFQQSNYNPPSPFSIAVDPENADDTYKMVIPGFSEGLLGMRTGETKVTVVPPNKGYTNPDDPNTAHLYGKTLVFQIELVSIDTA